MGWICIWGVVALLAFRSQYKDQKAVPTDCVKLQHKYDSVRNQAILDRYRINQIKYYLKIVDKRPSQAKFLHGWINRAVR